jgi:hypothetical protein
MLPGRYFKGSKIASIYIYIYICIGAAKKTWMYALHASHQLIELPAYIVQEPHIYTWLQAGHADTHTLQAMQALHTPVKHGLHHTSQLLPSCVYYMVWWDTYGLHVSGYSPRGKKATTIWWNYLRVYEVRKKVWKRQGCCIGNQAGSNMHEWDRWRMRWEGASKWV